MRKILADYRFVRMCIVFGSVASGKATSESDLGAAVAAEEPLTTEKRLELLEALSAAKGRTVDLIDLMTAAGPISVVS